MLETKRLRLRPWEDADAETLYKYAKEPDVGPIAGWPPHTSVEDSLNTIRGVLSAPETYAVVLKETGEPVGSIGLYSPDIGMETSENELELGYWIGKPLWGQGLIPEAAREMLRHAFEDLGCTVVWCAYYDGNEKSKRVQEKCGFRFHHTRHDAVVRPMNEVRTDHVTRLLREEWHEKSL